jgi:signal transduction histidine kinase
MLRSLRFKIPLAVLGVSLLSILLVALVARWSTTREFERLVAGQMRAGFVDQVRAYYAQNQTWAGVMQALPPPEPAPFAPPPVGRAKPPPTQQGQFALLDQQGCVVVPAGPFRLGDCPRLSAQTTTDPVLVDGQVVGTALMVERGPPGLSSVEATYLVRTNRALLWGALGAAALALLLGSLISRQLTLPLRKLTAALHSMAGGELVQRVPVYTQDELGEVATAFNQMSTDLAHANQARRQMTADIAHELRNPLMVMIGYLEAMRDEILKPTPERLATLHDEALHLQRLVSDLRTLSLADAGELTLQKELVAPEELILRVANAYQPQAAQKQIRLQTRLAEGLPEIEIDLERLAQVVGNLVSNALRHTPVQGVITLGAHPLADQVQLTVQDSGEGITPTALPYIFDRFYRGDPARQANEGASGLGLAIAKSLITAHGGTIAVMSQPGQGTTFTINLPIQASPNQTLRSSS